jgi:hypothetical protein
MQRPPSWQWHPRYHLVLWVAAVALCVWHLGGAYGAGAWLPSAADVARLVVGVLVGWLWVLPERVQYQQMGDAYIRAILSRQWGARLTGASPWLILAAVFSWAIAWTELGDTATSRSLLGMGILLGMLVAYSLRRAIYKRLWELYRAESADGEHQVGLGPTV